MPTDDMGGFLCPDDGTELTPHGGVLDVKKAHVVFWAICPVCVKAGRPPKCTARVDLDMKTSLMAKDDGLIWVEIGDAA